MKSIVKFSALSLGLIASTASHAANPMNGWYAGLILGGSYAPKTDLTFNAPNTDNGPTCSANATCTTATGRLAYSGYGNIGGQIGIRMNQFRIEAEPIVNYNPYQKITIGTTKYTSPKSSSGLRLKGSTTTAMLMINGFYDFYNSNGQSDFVPYVGAGIGYAYIDNSMRFYCNNTTIECTKLSKSNSSVAVQGAAGFAYFLDDFTWFGLDYRYITAPKVDALLSQASARPVVESKVQVHTINLSLNGMFNCG